MDTHRTFYRRWGKRVFDVLAASAGLIVLAPLFCLIAVVVRLFLGSPVLFRQKRGGFSQIPFTILKFRSMTDQRDAAGELLPDDARMTRLGRFLRTTSIDELPALFNVLRGEMSIVGPRPLLTRYEPWYTALELRRFEVLPGITGWAQINGRNALGWEERFQHDAQYVDNCGWQLDLKILYHTVGKVLRRENVHMDESRCVQALDEVRRNQPLVVIMDGDHNSSAKG